MVLLKSNPSLSMTDREKAGNRTGWKVFWAFLLVGILVTSQFANLVSLEKSFFDSTTDGILDNRNDKGDIDIRNAKCDVNLTYLSQFMNIKNTKGKEMKKHQYEKKEEELSYYPNDDPYKHMSNLILFLSAFPGGFDELESTFARSLQFFWPHQYLDLLIVLDENDETNKSKIEEQKNSLTNEVKSRFRHHEKFKGFAVHWNPLFNQTMFGAGWFIQQLVMFWADNFTDAPYIGFVDDDAVITRAIEDYDLFDKRGRPRAIVRYSTDLKRQYPDKLVHDWFSQCSWAYGGQQALVNAMSYFPVIIKREHFAEIRQTLLSHHPEFTTFDQFFTVLQGRGRFSQFGIMFDHLWRHHRDEYSWHFDPFLDQTIRGVIEGFKFPFHQFGLPQENNITEEMLQPFPRCAMHGLYVRRVGREIRRSRRTELMNEFLRRGYCYSQPIVPQEGAGGNSVNYTSIDLQCRKFYDVWNDINIENEWEFEVYGPSWTRVNYEGCVNAHRQCMI